MKAIVFVVMFFLACVNVFAESGVPGIIVPAKSGRGEDRVFWFDENRWGWTEECENGTKRIYGDAATASELRHIRGKRASNKD